MRRVRQVAISINTWAVSVVRYTAGVLDWKENELQALDVSSKILVFIGAVQMRIDVDRL